VAQAPQQKKTLAREEAFKLLSPKEADELVEGYLAKLAGAKEAEAKLRHLQSLRLLGAAAAKKSKSLERFMNDSDKHVRLAAAAAISYVRPDDCQAAYKLLLEFLDDHDPWFVIAASTDLGNMGKHAEPAVPHLIRALKRNYSEHLAIARALAQIGNKQAFDFLVELTDRGPTLGIRGAGASALAVMGKSGVDAIPVLQRLLEMRGDTDERIGTLGNEIAEARRSAVWALGKIGEFAPQKAVPLLSNVIADTNSSATVRESAMHAIQEIGAPAEASIPALALCLKEKKHVHLASRTLAKFGAAAIEPLFKFVMDKNEGASNRAIVFRAFEELALSHKEVYELIRTAEKDGDDLARRLAMASRVLHEKRKSGKR
jgi:HEAT repeat protein